MVEVAVDGGRVTAVRLAGLATDPPAAADAVARGIAAGLTGMAADTPVGGIAARVAAAVPFGVSLVGATARDIAAAVRAAIGGPGDPDRIGGLTAAEVDAITAGWRHLGWRVVGEAAMSAAANLAADDVLVDRLAAGRCPPTLRFWGWAEPAVVVGRSQAVAAEVDLGEAAAAGAAVVRRMTGGGAMLAEPGRTVTYSLVVPAAAVAGRTLRESYELLDAWVVRELRHLGVDAHYVPVNDIGVPDGKLAGAAQARRRGVVLHHTTLAYQMDAAVMGRLLRVGRRPPDAGGVASAAKRVSPLAGHTPLSRDAVVGRLVRGFVGRYGGTVGRLTADEEADIDRRAAAQYATPAWTHQTGHPAGRPGG